MKPGSTWRVLARDGAREVTAQNDGLFDELVVDRWLHLEQMTEDTWWMRVGDARLDIKVDRGQSRQQRRHSAGAVTALRVRGEVWWTEGGARVQQASPRVLSFTR